MATEISIDTNPLSPDRPIELLIRDLMPDLYQDDPGGAIVLLEAYFEWLAEINVDYKLLTYSDIDTTLDQYLGHFRAKYMEAIPPSIRADPRLLHKFILDLYRSKGSVRGTKLLFRLVFNEEIDVYFPGDDVLTPSDGDWYEPRYIEISSSIQNRDLQGKTVIGASSGARGIAEQYITQYINGKRLELLYISNITGVFAVGEKLTEDRYVNNVGVLSAPTILGSLSTVSFIQGGRNFSIGDNLKVVDGKGIEGEIRVTKTANGTGTLEYTIVDGGSGFSRDAIEIITRTSAGGQGASFDIGALSDVQNITINTDLISGHEDMILANTTIDTVDIVAPGTGYANGDPLVFTPDPAITTIIVTAGGVGYKNTDTIAITGSPGTGLTANVTTNGVGSIIDIDVITYGSGYTGSPVVAPVTTTGSGATFNPIIYAYGEDAAATVTTNGSGAITGIVISDRGIDYLIPPKATVTSTGGTGASLVAHLGIDTDYLLNPLFPTTIDTEIDDSLTFETKQFGKIIALTNIATGNNYNSTPDIIVRDLSYVPPRPGNVFFSTTSTQLTGVGTTFQTDFEVDNIIRLVRDTEVDHRIVKTITSNTSMTLDDNPRFTANATIESVAVVAGGTNYSNNDVPIFTANGSGTGAAAEIVTDNTGTIIAVQLTEGGEGYFNPPVISFSGGTGAGANLQATTVGGVLQLGLPTLQINYPDYVLAEANNSVKGQNEVITGEPIFGIGIIERGTVVNSGYGYEQDEIVQLAQYGAIERIIVLEGGSGYANSDSVIFTGGGAGDGASGTIVTDANGTILSASIATPGTGYTDIPIVSVVTANGEDAILTAEIGNLNFTYFVNGRVNLAGVGKLRGQWKSTKSFLNSDKYLHDSFYYQDFSYEIRSSLTLDRYSRTIKSLFHPAGTEMFGRVIKTDNVQQPITIVHESLTLS